MRRYGYLLLTGLFFLGGCNEFQQAVKDAKKELPPPPKDNYIVLLDLSDRILYNNQQQVPKDISAIKSIYNVFKARLNTKDPTHLYYGLQDKLKVLIAPQHTTPRNLYDMVGSLRIDLSAEQPDRKATLTDETQKTFSRVLPDIYKQAVIGNNSSAYSGADIWKYFNEDLQDDLEKDSQNTLFIITDGYMDLEKSEERPAQNNRFSSCSRIINALKQYPDWEVKFTAGDYGLLPINKNFARLKVVLLQMNPKDDWTGEYSLLTKIWGKWFNEMGIANYRFIKDDNINEVKESMEKFMEVKLSGTLLPDPWTKINTVDSALLQVTIAAQLADTAGTTLEKKINAAAKITITEPTALPSHLEENASTGKKKDKPLLKKMPAKEDDMLHDATLANGFNTSIKSIIKKKNR